MRFPHAFPHRFASVQEGYALANPLTGTAFGVAVPDVEIVVTSGSNAQALRDDWRTGGSMTKRTPHN